MSEAFDERLEALDIKIAYQEQTIAQLNEVVVAQHQRLDQLEKVCQSLRERLLSLAEPGADLDAHEPPPHY